MSFDGWWFNTGSGIIPNEDEDQETHTKRVAEMAYQVAILEMHYRNAGNAAVDSSVARYGA